MIKRIFFCALLVFSSLPAKAQTVEEQIVAQLNAQGFDEIEVSRTLFGRIKMIAYSDTHRRELVFHPSTGEILRDYWEASSGLATDPVVDLVDPNAIEKSKKNDKAKGKSDHKVKDKSKDKGQSDNSNKNKDKDK